MPGSYVNNNRLGYLSGATNQLRGKDFLLFSPNLANRWPCLANRAMKLLV